MIQLVRDEWKNGTLNELTSKFQASSQFGSTHGFLFSTYFMHEHDVKVYAFGRDKQNVSLTLQKQFFPEALRDFRPVASYNLIGDNKIIHTIENFKQKIIETVAKWGNKKETGHQLTQYVHKLISFVGTPSSKKNYMRIYLRGMFMTWPGPSSDYSEKSPFYNRLFPRVECLFGAR
uniref:Uncharacterized protein n=1 Tax=Romanomermis culicivorax TaxID=13658 RepID=A0A915HU96_ROMCU